MQISLSSFIESYLEEGDYSERTKYARRYLLARFVKNGLDLSQSPVDIKNQFLEIFGYLQGASFNPARAAVKTFFDYLIANNHYFYDNPINLVKRRKEAKKLVDPFTDEELEKILDRCSPNHRFMYEVFLNTGIRLDELVHLKFADFDSEKKVLQIRDRSSGGGAKGDKAREVHLPDLLLKKYETFLADFRLKRPQVSNYVFVNPQGSKIADYSIWGRMKRLGKKLQFRIHPHKFRATYATYHHREGTPILIISLLMGHESVETTARYISVTEEEKRYAQQKATWLGKKAEEAKKIEQLDREKQDLLSMVSDLIKREEALLKRIGKLDL